MEFSFIVLWIIATPIIIFSVGPEASATKKTGRLLLPLVAYLFFSALAMKVQECFPLKDNGCLGYKIVWLTILNLLFIMGVGWCEILWRERHKLRSWPLRENIQYGLVSNAILIISGCMTLLLAISVISSLSILRH